MIQSTSGIYRSFNILFELMSGKTKVTWGIVSKRRKGWCSYQKWIIKSNADVCLFKKDTYLFASETESPHKAPAALSWRLGEASEQDCARATWNHIEKETD